MLTKLILYLMIADNTQISGKEVGLGKEDTFLQKPPSVADTDWKNIHILNNSFAECKNDFSFM